MKVYSILVSVVLALILGYLAIVNFVENRDLPVDIATFSDFQGNKDIYKLSYSNNGDLIFSTVKLDQSKPSLTYWDYYGSTEVVSYKWVDEKTVSIEMKDSFIRISLSEFAVGDKD